MTIKTLKRWVQPVCEAPENVSCRKRHIEHIFKRTTTMLTLLHKTLINLLKLTKQRETQHLLLQWLLPTLILWLPELFAKNAFSDILEIFSLNMDQISFDLLPKRHLQHDGMPFFPLAARFTTFLLDHAQSFWTRKWPMSRLFVLFFFLFFFCAFSFSHRFPYLVTVVIDFLLGLHLVQKQGLRKHNRDANFTME